MASSSSTSTHQWTYDVFVSFRGEDIRKTFMDHLFTDFTRKGIHAFRDDVRLKRGEEISNGLYGAIEQSRFLIVIFSKNYATSTWCLRELVKILDCKKMENKYEVRTIFYDVKPSVVRNQTESYGEALTKHEASKQTEVDKWKQALTNAANLSGWDLQDLVNGYESKFIDMISKDILCKLCEGPLDVGENLVGLDCRVEEMNLSQFVGSRKVHMIGICGIGGVGKTTIAKVIFNLLYIHYEGCSFCEEVKCATKQQDLVYLQKQLLADIAKIEDIRISSVSGGTRVLKERMGSKRVLIVLDDVDHSSQLEALAGERTWFGEGSMIVLTGRDRQLLKAHRVDEIYEVDPLYDDEAHELFSLHAFREKCPGQDFRELSYRVVSYVQGVPLALKVLGRFLYDKTVREWESELQKLQRIPNYEVQQVLKLSYDGLDSSQRSTFLDIACFFHGENKDFVMKILDGCNLFPDTNFRALVDKSLLTISSNKLFMHDLLRAMGREIVRDESEDLGKRSRLWFPEDVCNVLDNDKGMEEVQGLVLDLSTSGVQIGSKTFARMNNLRLLNLYYDLLNDTREVESIKSRSILRENSKAGSSVGLHYLSNELRWFYWHGYPFEFLPSAFYPKNLVLLDLSYSDIQQLWTGLKSFPKLIRMKLSHCHNLTETPDFTEISNLEELILEGCTNLVEIHPSVGLLKKLLVLNLEKCINLRSLPSSIESKSLEVLLLSGCSDPFSPETSWYPWFLSFLKRKQSPQSLALPSLSGLCMLRALDVSHQKLPGASLNEIKKLTLLEELNLSGNDFQCIPVGFSQHLRLDKLGLVGCKNLQALPELPSSISVVDVVGCTSLRELPNSTTKYKNGCLTLDFTNCPKLAENRTSESLINLALPQKSIDQYEELDLFLPGNQIPAWFHYQSIGSSIMVELPPQWNHKDLKGIAACAVFAPKNSNCFRGRSIRYLCDIKSLSRRFIYGFGYETSFFPNEIRKIESDQMWLSYRESSTGWENVEDYIVVSFEGSSPDIEVKECGIRLVYAADEQNAIQG